MALSHVALTVSDRERSAASFAEYFGLTGRVHDDEHPLILGDGAGSLLALTEGRVPARCRGRITSASKWRGSPTCKRREPGSVPPV